MRIVGGIGMPSVKNFRLDSSWEKESPEADFVKVHFLTRDRVAELAGNPILNPWVLLLFLKQIGRDGTGDGSQGAWQETQNWVKPPLLSSTALRTTAWYKGSTNALEWVEVCH